MGSLLPGASKSGRSTHPSSAWSLSPLGSVSAIRYCHRVSATGTAHLLHHDSSHTSSTRQRVISDNYERAALRRQRVGPRVPSVLALGAPSRLGGSVRQLPAPRGRFPWAAWGASSSLPGRRGQLGPAVVATPAPHAKLGLLFWCGRCARSLTADRFSAFVTFEGGFSGLEAV